MMERSPTWYVWKLLQSVPPEAMYTLFPYLKPHSARRNPFLNVWTWIAICVVIAFCWASYIYLFSFPVDSPFPSWTFYAPVYLFITVHSLIYGLRLVYSLAKYREAGNFDLFKLLPSGEFNMVLDIVRVHRHSFGGQLGGVSSALIAVCLLFPCALLYSLPVSTLEALMTMWGLVFSLVYFVTYLQSFISITLIALVTSQQQRREEAQVRTLVYFVVLQFVVCIGLNGLLDMVTVSFISLDRRFLTYERLLALVLTWSLLLLPLILMGVRELVNFGLWQAVKRRLEAE